MTCSKKSVKQWYGTEAETAITYVMQIVGAIFGPMAGTNCAIRAARVVREWSILDGRFSYWKKNFGTPADEHGGWHFAEELVVRPLFKWMTASWDFMRANVINAAVVPTNPGTLEVTLSEQVMRTTPTYSLMSTALSRMVLNKRETHDQFQGSDEEETSSDDTSDSMNGSSDDTSDTSESESDSPPASVVKKKAPCHGKKKKKAQNSGAKMHTPTCGTPKFTHPRRRRFYLVLTGSNSVSLRSDATHRDHALASRATTGSRCYDWQNGHHIRAYGRTRPLRWT
jgi:hypothetical protein